MKNLSGIYEVQTIFTVMLKLLCFYCIIMCTDDARVAVYKLINSLIVLKSVATLASLCPLMGVKEKVTVPLEIFFPLNFFLRESIYLFRIYECFACMCCLVLNMCPTHGGQKRALELPELEL